MTDTNQTTDGTKVPADGTISRFRETIEIAAGTNITGHEDMAAAAHTAPAPRVEPSVTSAPDPVTDVSSTES